MYFPLSGQALNIHIEAALLILLMYQQHNASEDASIHRQ